MLTNNIKNNAQYSQTVLILDARVSCVNERKWKGYVAFKLDQREAKRKWFSKVQTLSGCLCFELRKNNGSHWRESLRPSIWILEENISNFAAYLTETMFQCLQQNYVAVLWYWLCVIEFHLKMQLLGTDNKSNWFQIKWKIDWITGLWFSHNGWMI